MDLFPHRETTKDLYFGNMLKKFCLSDPEPNKPLKTQLWYFLAPPPGSLSYEKGPGQEGLMALSLRLVYVYVDPLTAQPHSDLSLCLYSRGLVGLSQLRFSGFDEQRVNGMLASLGQFKSR